MSPVASARETGEGGAVELRFPFDRDLVDALKTEAPAFCRRWDANEKVSRVMSAYAETALDLLTAHFPNAELPEDRVSVRQPRKAARQRTPQSVPEIVPIAGDDATERDALVASIHCPHCGTRRDRPMRVVTQAAATIACRETITPEVVLDLTQLAHAGGRGVRSSRRVRGGCA